MILFEKKFFFMKFNNMNYWIIIYYVVYKFVPKIESR